MFLLIHGFEIVLLFVVIYRLKNFNVMKFADLVQQLKDNTALVGVISDRVQKLLDAIAASGGGDVPADVVDAAKEVTDSLVALKTKAGA